MPARNAPYWIHLYRSGIENSSTMTSLAAMYRKVPPANELKITSTISELCCRAMPSRMPTGVAAAKILKSSMPFFSSFYSTKFFVIETPRDMAAAGL